MSASIGVNLRVTGHSHQGGRKYMEDIFSVAYQSTADEKDLEYAFFGIFDGHGGRDAAQFAKDNLMDFIVKQKSFWSDRDEDVLRAISEGFVATHNAMWKVIDKWPKTSSGLPSTSGTTASVAFIRRGKVYIGHVGDSGIVLGCSDELDGEWKAMPLTNDHKPECEKESRRIHDAGGKVVNKMGVPRVVWNRPKPGHQGPVRRSTPFDEVPFLAVARALGDLWSHNKEHDSFVVSPVPDVHVFKADASKHRCLILGTDGLWNVMTPQQAVQIVQETERYNASRAMEVRPNIRLDTKEVQAQPTIETIAFGTLIQRMLRLKLAAFFTMIPQDHQHRYNMYLVWMQLPIVSQQLLKLLCQAQRSRCQARLCEEQSYLTRPKPEKDPYHHNHLYMSRKDKASSSLTEAGLHFHVVGEGVVRVRSGRHERLYDKENYIDFRMRLLGEPGKCYFLFPFHPKIIRSS
ncbi:Hypothetical predicted protein [Cloeon dipterum]|uniref:PPM-type phosphatase domain-containing protein n=1 Tax=Cloeon dipterum TaxID=197152 RepID=A0A8S1DJ22_9INSE|nr:Hypothetical predicted protein [Cloeon dipterum]